MSFSDGRALCYLVHHYHPGYLPLDAVCQRTTQTVECMQTGSVVLNSSSEAEDSGLDVFLDAPAHGRSPVRVGFQASAAPGLSSPEPSDLSLPCTAAGAAGVHRELLENEKKNFQLVGAAVRDLGGVPAMLRHEDMSNTIPDEKVLGGLLLWRPARGVPDDGAGSSVARLIPCFVSSGGRHLPVIPVREALGSPQGDQGCPAHPGGVEGVQAEVGPATPSGTQQGTDAPPSDRALTAELSQLFAGAVPLLGWCLWPE